MKKPTISLVAILALVTLSLVLPMKASAYRGWAVGEWRLLQYYTENGRQVSFNGRLRIHREGDRFYGHIYFDVVGDWEPLENIEVTDETIRFTRPMYEQRFRGHRQGNQMSGTYRDRIHDGEWTWRAERE
jgi:hypothetical protein